MKECYALLTVEAGREREVLDKLRTHEWVESSYILFGEYDIIVKMKGETLDLITCKERLNEIDGIGNMNLFEVIDVVV